MVSISGFEVTRDLLRLLEAALAAQCAPGNCGKPGGTQRFAACCVMCALVSFGSPGSLPQPQMGHPPVPPHGPPTTAPPAEGGHVGLSQGPEGPETWTRQKERMWLCLPPGRAARHCCRVGRRLRLHQLYPSRDPEIAGSSHGQGGSVGKGTHNPRCLPDSAMLSNSN